MLFWCQSEDPPTFMICGFKKEHMLNCLFGIQQRDQRISYDLAVAIICRTGETIGELAILNRQTDHYIGELAIDNIGEPCGELVITSTNWGLHDKMADELVIALANIGEL